MQILYTYLSKNNGNKGSVLIFVLLMISILVVTVMESMRLMQIDSMSSRIFTTNIQGNYLTQSGLAYARYLLQKDLQDLPEDAQISDHKGEDWAKFPQHSTDMAPIFKTGEINGTIVDEQSKFPINYLINKNDQFASEYKQVFDRLLSSPPFSLKPEKRTKLIMAIKDWLDSDSIPSGDLGFENPFYQSQETDYSCKNDQLHCLGELKLIPLITHKIYFGTKDKPGLRDLCTIYSNGKININTASYPLLAAMVKKSTTQETAAEFAQSMLRYRQKTMHFEFLSERDWYRNRMAGYNDIQLPSNLITTHSQYFSILVQAMNGQSKTSLMTVVNRTQDKKYINIETKRKEFH